MTDPSLTQPAGRSDATALDARPGLVSTAFALVAAAAATNVGIGALVLLQAPTAAKAAGGGAVGLLVVVAAIALLYAATLVVLAVAFRSGRPWGRVALFTATLFSLVSLIAPTLPALVVIVLLLVADVIMYRPAVTVWVRSLRGVGRA